MTRDWTLITCLAVSHPNLYTWIFSAFVWCWNWILFMHEWFCPIRLIHLIRWKYLHFEKNQNSVPRNIVKPEWITSRPGATRDIDKGRLLHRRDSIQGTDYIATYFFLNLKVSRAKIENLKLWIGGDIISLTFGKIVTLLVQKLKTLGKKTDM